MKTITVVILSICVLCTSIAAQSKDKATFVNPFIGTGGHGHTFPGVSAPFGMVQLSPDKRVQGWDACSGYYYADDTIIGFSHTHLSGMGAIDYGDILLMPLYGERAQFYKNVFHSAAGFMRGKRNGIWMEPFAPNAVTFEYTEANAWQYSFFAPHDVQGLVTLMGGNEAFIDCGQMSAWYVFSAMEFYPVCPGQDIYVNGD